MGGYCKYVAKEGQNDYLYHRNNKAHWNGYCQDRRRELHQRCEADHQCAQGVCNRGRCKGCYHHRESANCTRSEGCVWAGDSPGEKCRLDCFLIRSESTCRSVANPEQGTDYCEWRNNGCEPLCERVTKTVHGSC